MRSPSPTEYKLFPFIGSFLKNSRIVLSCLTLVSLVWAIDAVIWPYLLKLIIDILTQFDAHRALAWSALKPLILFGLFFWFFVECGFRYQGFLLAKLLPNLEASIRLKMFNHIQRHSPKYFSEQFAGSLANHITDMTTQVSLLLQQMITVFIPSAAAYILAVIFFTNINLLFALIFGIWIIIHFGICLYFSRHCDHHQGIHGKTRSYLLGRIVDSLMNNFAVNLFFRFNYELSAIKGYQSEEKEKNWQAKKHVELMRSYLGFFTFLIGGLFINGLMLYLWLHDKISTGEVAQIVNMNWNIIAMMWFSSMEIPSFIQSYGIARQALSVMNHPEDILDIKGATPLVVKKGEIVFHDVTFQYGDRLIFKNKSVKIHGGEKVGLVGSSGAGKSTFTKLIMRMHPIDKGKILIDGQDIALVTLESLRKQIAHIPQDTVLFHRTLEENIRYGRIEATEEEVLQAAKLAHCDEFIKRLPAGYQTLVGERGSKLSGGERQRIAIARAILANAPILILDEATSALDSATETYIQDSLATLMQDRTTLVIAHRLSTLAMMDRILVFEQGVIVEEGHHDDLIAKGGAYANMWQLQAGAFLGEYEEDEED